MLNKLRVRVQEEKGFTLVELLVVMLILGLLAAIAIPSFFNQRDKAKDADAKASVRTAQTAMETYATGNGGDYTGATAGTTTSELNEIEPTLNDVGDRLSIVGTPDTDSYTVQVESDTSNANLFQITRSSDGTTTLDCGTTAGPPMSGGGKDGCPSDGNWGD